MNARKEIGRPLGRLQVIPDLQIEPELSGDAEILAQAQRRVGGKGTLLEDDLINRGTLSFPWRLG